MARRPLLALLAALALAGCNGRTEVVHHEREAGPDRADEAVADTRPADQAADERAQKGWDDVRNAGSEQEQIDRANAALREQRARADGETPDGDEGTGGVGDQP